MIKLKNIYKSYKEFSLSINELILPDNGLILLCGRNGSGKSTLLNIISLNDLDFHGDIYYNDEILKKDNYKKIKNKEIIFVLQKHNFIDFLNASDNLNLNNYLKDNQETIMSEAFKNKKNNELSDGEKTIIEIDRALFADKKIFLFDEITNFLSFENTLKVLDKLKEVSKDNLVIVVSHDERIKKEFEYFIELENGKIKNRKLPKTNEETTNQINNARDNAKVPFKLSFKFFLHNMFKYICFVLLLSFTSFFGVYSIDESTSIYNINRELNNDRLYLRSLLSFYDFEDNNTYFSEIDEKYYRTNIPKGVSNKLIRKVEDTFNKENIYYLNWNLNFFIGDLYNDDLLHVNNSFLNRALNVDYKNNLVTYELYGKTITSDFVLDRGEYRTCFISHEGFENSKVSEIKLNNGLRINENLNLEKNVGTADFLMGYYNISYISESDYENKYGKNIDVKDNEIYLPKNLNAYYVKENIKFNNISEGKNADENFINLINLNDIFIDTKLVKLNEECDSVIISDNNFDKINDLTRVYERILVDNFDNQNIHKLKSFLKSNTVNAEFISLEGQLLNSFKDIYLSKKYYYESLPRLIILILVTQISNLTIIYLLNYHFYNRNKRNLLIFKSLGYENKIKDILMITNTVIIIFCFLIGIMLELINAIVTSNGSYLGFNYISYTIYILILIVYILFNYFYIYKIRKDK